MHCTDIVRAMIGYHQSTTRRVWDSVMTLTDAQFNTDVDYSRSSICAQMVHLANADRFWLRRLREAPDPREGQAEAADYPTREAARALWESVAESLSSYVDALDDDALARTPKDMPMPVWQTLMHVANHGTDHRAQVLRILHDFGAPTFDQDADDYFNYYSKL